MIIIGFDTTGACDQHKTWKKLLTKIVTEYAGQPTPEIRKDDNGKPRADGVCFSVSHSSEIVMCAAFVGKAYGSFPEISAGERIDLGNGELFFHIPCRSCFEIGADVEVISKKRDTSRLISIAERYFTPDEIAFVRNGGKNAFYRIWTEKESFLKLNGAGLRDIRCADTRSLPSCFSMTSFTLLCRNEVYSASVCCEDRTTD